MADTLQDIGAQVEARMQELAPLVEEFFQLQEVSESLKAKAAGGDGRSGAARARRPGTSRASGKARRAPRGQNRAAILALIGERPGITSREIADTTGIGRRVVSTAVSKYKREGLLVADGGGVQLTAAGTDAV